MLNRRGHERRTASVRLICASNVDLQYSVQRGKFREGLLVCVGAGSLRLSALRERKGDIPNFVIIFCKNWLDS